jgi:hypothetical protein
VRPYLEKPITKIGLVELLKVKALSANASTTKKKRERKKETIPSIHIIYYKGHP